MKPLIFVHQGVSGKAETAIELFGYTVIRLPSFRALNHFVCGHPDSLLFPLPDGRILLHRDYYRENRVLFDAAGLKYELTCEPVGPRYPSDVLFNALAAKGVLYGKLDSVSKLIKSRYKLQVNVKQGYARCSVLMLGKNAAATFDRSLAAALISGGINVLLLPPGKILLRGEAYENRIDDAECVLQINRFSRDIYKSGKITDADEAEPENKNSRSRENKTKPRGDFLRCDGFIGGCGVMLDDVSCGFFSDITAYEHFDKLNGFAQDHGIKLLSLCDGHPEDFGGAVTVRPQDFAL